MVRHGKIKFPYYILNSEKNILKNGVFVIRDPETGQFKQVTVEPIPDIGTVPSVDWNKAIKEKGFASREFQGKFEKKK